MSEDRPSAAECLVMVEKCINTDRSAIIDTTGIVEQSGVDVHVLLARAKTALDFSKRDTGFKFRAMVEEWTLAQIIREMY